MARRLSRIGLGVLAQGAVASGVAEPNAEEDFNSAVVVH